MRKALFAIMATAALVLVAAAVSQQWFTRTAKESAPTALGEASSREGQQVTARGILVPTRWERLSFAESGQLESLLVKVGDQVASGQVLASLATDELGLSVALAKNELDAQEATLTALEKGTSSAEFAAAQASYEAAVAAYEELNAGPSPDEMAVARAELKKAEETVRRAQASYDAVRNLPDIGARREAVELQNATIDYDRAKAQYEMAVAKASKAALKQAESAVAAARARLDAFPAELRAAQAGVARARIELARAELSLHGATLSAPFTGTVTTLGAQPGDLVGPGTTVLTLADLSEFQVELTDLDEWAAATARLNQSVTVWVPGLDNRSLRGSLVSVALEPTLSSTGAVFYKAIVALEKQDKDLRWGMTTHVTFARITGRAGQ